MTTAQIWRSEEQAVFALRGLYQCYGYTPYKMSRFEEYDLYVRNKDFLISDRIITFSGEGGQAHGTEAGRDAVHREERPGGIGGGAEGLLQRERLPGLPGDHAGGAGVRGRSDGLLREQRSGLLQRRGVPGVSARNHCQYDKLPLEEEFTLNYRKYCGKNKPIVIANPNAPTGMTVPLHQIEQILRTNPDSLVVVDEAYVDFGGKSALPLIGKYENLLVVRTFSKSRCLAGGRLGYAFACPEVIADLEKIKYSTTTSAA